MSTISKEAEQRILQGLYKVAELVNDGLSPNDAIVKVAREEHIPAGHVKLMVNAYNTGRTNKQRSSGHSLFDKSAEFDLADADTILETIYPKHVKTAEELVGHTVVSDSYALPPSWLAGQRREKVATTNVVFDDAPEPAPRDPEYFYKRARGYLQGLQRERENLYAGLTEMHDKLASTFGALCHYFRNLDALPFEDVYANASAYFGKAAASILDKVAEYSDTCMSPKKPVKLKKPAYKEEKPQIVMLKRAHVVKTPLRLGETPYREVEEFITKAAEYQALFEKAAEFEKNAVALELKLGRALAADAAPLPADATLSIMKRASGIKRLLVEKQAFPFGTSIGQGMQFALGQEAGKSIMSRLTPKSDDKLKQDAYEDVSDPSHEAKLRSIRAQATLHGLLNSPYFEGEDPHQVTDLFNKVTHLSPRMAEQPILLEAAMKRLMSQGSADPHDLDQLMGIELKQKQRDDLPSGNPGSVGLLAPKLLPQGATPGKV